MSLGITLLTSLVKHNSLKEYMRLSIDEKYFKPSERELYKAVATHVFKYGIPSPHTFEEMAAECDVDVPVAHEPPEYYMEKVRERYISDTLKLAVQGAGVKIKEGDSYQALEDLTKQVIDLSIQKIGGQIVDLRDSWPIVKKVMNEKLWKTEQGIKMGWPYLDNMAEGLRGGDMVSYIGRPGMGKTFQLLYTGHNAWYNQKVPVLLISMEMIPLLILQRLTAMHGGVSLTALKKAEMSSESATKLGVKMTNLGSHEVPYYIVNGNLTATVEDIWQLCKQLKPGLLLVDGAYLVRTKDARMGKFERIGHVAESLKSMIATELDIPVIATYQFNRDAKKKTKKDEKPGLEDIYGSDVIGQVSSIVLGLLEDDGVETIERRRVDILKGRSGETGFFYSKWDFVTMDFSEWDEEKLEGLQFL